MCGGFINNVLEGAAKVVGDVGDTVTKGFNRTAESETFKNTANAAATAVVGGALVYGAAAAGGAGGGAAGASGTAGAGATTAAAGEGFAAGVAGEVAGAGAASAGGTSAITSSTVLGGLRTAAQVAASARSLSNAISPPSNPVPVRPGPAVNGVLPIQYVPAQASGIKNGADPSPVFVGAGAGNSGPDAAELIAIAAAVGGIYFALK